MSHVLPGSCRRQVIVVIMTLFATSVLPPAHPVRKAAHTRLGRSVGREDRPPQWGVVHEHTPVSIPVFLIHEHKNCEFEFSLTDLGRGGQATRTLATHANSHR